MLFRNPFSGFVTDTVPNKRTAATLKNPSQTTIKEQGLYYCTILIKKIKKFLIFKEIQTGLVSTSLYLVKYFSISSYIRKPSSYMTCNRSYLNFLINEENFLFFFISAFLKRIKPPVHKVIKLILLYHGASILLKFFATTNYIK